MNNMNKKRQNNKKSVHGIRRTLFIGLTLSIVFCFFGCSKGDYSRPGQLKAKEDKTNSKSIKRFFLITCPHPEPSASYIKYNRLSNYLQRSTGFKVELFMPKTFKEFINRVKNQEIDFLFIDPIVYFEVENFINKNYMYARLSGEGKLKDKPFETACIIARADSKIKTINDIRGKRVVFGSKRSAAKWIAAKKLFMDNGINIETDLAEYRFGHKCKDIALDIFYKKADVGCVRTEVCPICKNCVFYKKCGLDTDELLHIAKTAPVNTWIFTCTKSLNGKNMKKIANALLKISELELHEKERLSKDLKYGFVKVDDNWFEELRKMVEVYKK